jgi:hypothetical protein
MFWKPVESEDVTPRFGLKDDVSLPIVDKGNCRPGKNKLEGVDDIISAHVLDDHYRTFLERGHPYPCAQNIDLHAKGTVDGYLFRGHLQVLCGCQIMLEIIGGGKQVNTCIHNDPFGSIPQSFGGNDGRQKEHTFVHQSTSRFQDEQWLPLQLPKLIEQRGTQGVGILLEGRTGQFSRKHLVEEGIG